MKNFRQRPSFPVISAALLALLALTLTPALLLAQPPGRGGGPGGFGPEGFGPGHGPGHFGHGPGGGGFFGRGFARLAERLELTAEQQETIRGITDSFRDTLRTQRQAVGELHRSLKEQSRAATLDEAAIRRTSEELGLAQADLAVTEGRMHQEVRQVLTPDQLAKLDELHQLRQERMEARRQRWEERRGSSEE